MVFEVVVKNFNIFGINSKQAEKTNPINKRIFVGFVMLGFNAFFQYMYIINEAQGFQEYIECIYMTSIGTVSCLILATIVFQMKSFFGLIAWANSLLLDAGKDKGSIQCELIKNSSS